MAKQQKTVFQRLNDIFGPDGVNVQKNQTNRYNMANTELLRTQDQAEYERIKLQAQQNKHLGKVWQKVDNEMFQQSVHYEVTRIGSYADFESMEFYPEIAAALDIMAEESCTPNDHGQIVNIYSDSKRVKAILEDLFKNRLDIHTSLPMWTRNTCKYGDNFVLLNIDDKAGIIGAKQMPNFEFERKEGDFFHTINSNGKWNGNKDENSKTKFIWKTKGMEFNSWQVAHFRLLGDDRKIPYGTSVLEKARRIWKQLVLAEDAMLIYRVTRAPERRVYKVFVGNIDDADVGAYMNEIANRFKRTPMYDSKTGQMDVRFNQLGLDQDIFIPVRDENAATPIDTLPGAQNLDQISDIEYLQRKLFTALRVPKSFLGYEEAVGEGKNLALQDMRFSRTINRIQQAMIMELNKIAIIHLSLLGFDEELDNFTITLNNPSTQAEMLKIEHEQQKFTAFKDAVSDAGNGFAIMSMTRAKREILGWSDDQIKQDLLEQRMEKAAAAELENTANVIKHTGMFDTVDKIYGDMEAAKEGGVVGGEDNKEGGPSGGGGGGFGGGGGLGGEDLDFGDEGDEEVDTAGGETGDLGSEEPSAEEMDFGAEEPADAETPQESIQRIGKVITERRDQFINRRKAKVAKYRSNYLDLLAESIVPSKREAFIERTKIYDKSLKINESIDDMINEINNKLDEE